MGEGIKEFLEEIFWLNIFGQVDTGDAISSLKR